jgi:signal transduction histidine kinase/HAMP domain-containing protein
MTFATRVRDLPLRTQLMLVFAFLSIATTAISTITLTSMSEERMRAGLRDRSQRIARRLQQQLQPIVASGDHLAARALLGFYAGDRELDGIAVYAGNGELIAGTGIRPPTLPSINADIGATAGHEVALADIKTGAGREGRLYLSFSTNVMEQMLRRDAWIAAALGGCVVLCALLLAAQTSRYIARRLVNIADAAKRMASGDLAHIRLDDTAKDEIGDLAHSFNVMVYELNRLSVGHERLVSTQRERLESLVSQRTQALEQSRETFRLIAESTKAIPFTLDLASGAFPYIGALAVANLGLPESRWKEPAMLDVVMPAELNRDLRRCLYECAAGPFEFEGRITRAGGVSSIVRWMGTCERAQGGKFLRGLMQDVTELRGLEQELASAQKLESVGRLAAGVAHEINTPVQFVSDNVEFVRVSMGELASVVHAHRCLLAEVESSGNIAAAAHLAANAEKAVDLDYVLENMPLAIASAIEGLKRIATIVRSMKEFAYPDKAKKTAADLNQAIQSTLVIANNEYKYVALIETEFGKLPPVQCYLGEINQVVLNLLVNAAHAIADVVKGTSNLGTLTVRTRLVGDEVEISVGDTGSGIPENVRDRIFEPFFTTKEIGKGTGQGLALAHTVIVKKHGGSLRFETECGVGTTFFIRLPVGTAAADQDAEQEAA